MGKSILESYSRVLESVAFNIVARIDDLLYVDDLTKSTDKLPMSYKRVSSTLQLSVPISTSTPYRTSFATSGVAHSPSAFSPARGERTPFVGRDNIKPPRRGLGVRRVLTSYLVGDPKAKNNGPLMEGSTRTIVKPGCALPVAPGIDKENSDPQKCLSLQQRNWSKLRPNN